MFQVHGPSSIEATNYKKLFLLTTVKPVFGCWFFTGGGGGGFFPRAQKLVRFPLATQNDHPFLEWTFLANTSIFRLNCLSNSSRWSSFEEMLHLERPASQVQQELVERNEIVGIFLLRSFSMFPSHHFPLRSRERPCFFDSTSLCKAETEGTLRRYYRNEWRTTSFLSFGVSSSQHGKPTPSGHRG